MSQHDRHSFQADQAGLLLSTRDRKSMAPTTDLF
jgi:hypothetical protein